MRWVKMFPGWLGWVFAAFGLSIVVGAILGFRRAPEMTLPGIVVGVVWALVGVKAGLPLFPTVSGDPGSDTLATGVRRIVWRRRRMWLAILGVAILCFAVAGRLAQERMAALFFVAVLLPGSLSVVAFLSGCPRCGNFFYPVGRFVLFTNMNRCQSCRLELSGGETGKHAA